MKLHTFRNIHVLASSTLSDSSQHIYLYLTLSICIFRCDNKESRMYTQLLKSFQIYDHIQQTIYKYLIFRTTNFYYKIVILIDNSNYYYYEAFQ